MDSMEEYVILLDLPNGEGEWSWGDIAIDAGFSRMLAEHMYRHLCGYAHSSSLSVLQWQQALMGKELEQLVGSSVNIVKVLVANVIQEYCTLFSKAQDVLKASGASEFVKTWVDIGQRLDENLEDVGSD